jgi:hypothetical protein
VGRVPWVEAGKDLVLEFRGIEAAYNGGYLLLVSALGVTLKILSRLFS